MARWMKLVLCAFLVFGLLPGSDEVVETIAHLVHDGHLPHSTAHDDVEASEDCDASDEHGCTPLAHHCQCCVSIAALPEWTQPGPPLVLAAVRELSRSGSDRGPPSASVEPFFRPPIT